MQYEIMSAIVRIRAALVDRETLEAALGAQLERYEIIGSGAYAQIAVPIEKDFWIALGSWLGSIGPRISSLQEKDIISHVGIDLAVPFFEDFASLSLDVPSAAAATIGSYGINIQFSIYATSANE